MFSFSSINDASGSSALGTSRATSLSTFAINSSSSLRAGSEFVLLLCNPGRFDFCGFLLPMVLVNAA